MFFFLVSACLPKETTYIAQSRIVLVDEQPKAKELSMEAREALAFSETEWWDPLPVFRWFNTYEEWDPVKIEADSNRIYQWFFERGWRDVVVQAKFEPLKKRPFYRAPRNREGLRVEYEVTLGERWAVEKVRVQGLEHAPIKIESIPSTEVYWNLSLQREITDEIKRKMGALGYADVDVRWQSRIIGEKRIVLEALVFLNQLYRFGSISYQDISILDQDKVGLFFPQDHLKGQPYNENRVRRMSHRLEQVPSYSDVEIISTLSRELQEVDLLIRITPEERWQTKPVINVASEATTYAVSGGLDWEFHGVEKN